VRLGVPVQQQKRRAGATDADADGMTAYLKIAKRKSRKHKTRSIAIWFNGCTVRENQLFTINV
jgi:hypothetical protein